MRGIEAIDCATLQAWLDQGRPAALVDVRSPAEMRHGMLPQAWPMPLHTLPARLAELSADGPIVLYCRSGARSGQACAYLNSRGWSSVYNLEGGIEQWLAQGRALAPVRAAAAGE